ncbi:MAG: ribosome maturation factor RimM [Xanthomonadales bacterium]|nr:ribosome maturation factor RimM [Xanthomonadales bacterium]
MNTPADRILLGEVVGVFGVQGQLKLRSHTDPPDALARYKTWFVTHRGREVQMSRPRCRVHGKGLVATFPYVADRDAAESWVGAQIWVERSALPKLPQGEYYWADLEGLSVETVEGVVLGVVSHLFATGANDVVAVKGERERLIPFVQPDVIRSIDLAQERMVVDWDPEF